MLRFHQLRILLKALGIIVHQFQLEASLSLSPKRNISTRPDGSRAGRAYLIPNHSEELPILIR